MLSIIETAKENGLKPFEYLVYIFSNAPNWDLKNNPNLVENILPEAVCAKLKV
jgi:hypothetical protein